MVHRSARRPIVLAGALVLALAGTATAQGPRIGIGLLGGGSEYDLAGTGTAFAAGVRLEVPLVGILLLEPGVSYYRIHPEGEAATEILFPEVGLQAEPLRGRWRPYLGVGAGWASVIEGVSGTEFTLHGALGLKLRVAPRLDLRGELRVRAVDPFAGTTADYVGGFTFRP